jgi:hypothetical protein
MRARALKVDAFGNLSVSPQPAAATAVTSSSGNQANANAVATLAGVANKTTYISGL